MDILETYELVKQSRRQNRLDALRLEKLADLAKQNGDFERAAELRLDAEELRNAKIEIRTDVDGEKEAHVLSAYEHRLSRV